jgi:hypothetical protein
MPAVAEAPWAVPLINGLPIIPWGFVVQRAVQGRRRESRPRLPPLGLLLHGHAGQPP